jgi:hypothetical protein
MAPSIASSRTSTDKSRAKKLIGNTRVSHDADSRDGHKRSESVLSDETKQTLAAYNGRQPSYEVFSHHSIVPADQLTMDLQQDASLQEFDDLMRSDSTMKVSLTPDRLKTMEVWNTPISH